VQAPTALQGDQSTSHAELLRRAGVTVNTTGGATRIDIPPLPSIKYLRMHILIAALLGVLVLVSSISSISEPEAAPAAIEFGVITAIVITYLVHRWRRHFLFEVDDASVNLLNLAGGKPKLDRSWPRREVTDVRIIANGKLWLRAEHREGAEIYLTPWRNVNEAIAAELRAAIAANPVDAATVDRQLWYTSSAVSEPNSWSVGKRILLIFAMVLCAVGFAVLIFGHFVLSILCFMIAAAPAGLALGTQDKEFYL
jgi:hypothetical protein